MKKSIVTIRKPNGEIWGEVSGWTCEIDGVVCIVHRNPFTKAPFWQVTEPRTGGCVFSAFSTTRTEAIAAAQRKVANHYATRDDTFAQMIAFQAALIGA
jgi:hypothetical protein